MGVSSNSHGKKSDKECQSPMLKIFKDIMQKEKNDPEKRNLLLNKKEERKKKYFSSRNKTDRRSRESSSSEQRKRNHPFNTSIIEQRTGLEECRTNSIPFQNEKRDSWFFWGDTTGQNGENAKPSEDTCSCVSCALKKIISSEYACVGCLVVILTISIVVAFLVVCKNVPNLIATEKSVHDATVDSERLKRKIDMLNNRKKEFESRLDKNHWKDAPAQMNGLSEIAGSEFGPSFGELNTMEDDTRFTGDLNNILDNDKINEFQNSERLRDFYRKLMQTDSQIRNLKKAYGNSDIEAIKNPERIKRSLKLHNLFKYVPKYKKRINEKKPLNNTIKPKPMTKKGKDHRFKRISNYTKEPMGFVVEKKKVLIQYKPTGLKKVAKCSHTPKDSNTHEKQQNHPFYKNTQRLDELLDTFLTKNLPEIMSDPFGLDKLFKNDNNKDKHEKKIEPVKKFKVIKEQKINKADIMKMLKPESTTDHEKEQPSVFSKDKVNKLKTSSKSDYEIVLSVSTILDPGMNRIGKTPKPLMDKVPNIRRLMQVDSDDDETLGYEDLKEVLSDDLHNHDEFDRGGYDRQKRTDENNLQLGGHKIHIPTNIINPNWKGPMPLYPDELNMMVQPAAVNNNKVKFPVNTKDIKLEIDKTEKDLNDIEYVEDYLNNKYDKLVQIAQAYSDYGVLDGKKVEKEKTPAADEKTEHKVKLSLDTGLFKRGLFPRKKKDPNEMDPSTWMINMMNSSGRYVPPSDGIKFEIRPTSSNKEDNLDISKLLKHHFRITSESDCKNTNLSKSNLSDFSTSYPYMDIMYNTENYDDKSKLEKETTKHANNSTEINVVFTISKGKRALLSIDLERDELIESTTTKTEAVTDIKYYAETTMYQVTGIENINRDINNKFEAYSTALYKKDDINKYTHSTIKTYDTLNENQPSVNENKRTTAINTNTTDLQNASSTVSNKNSNMTGTESISTDTLHIEHKQNTTDHRIDKLDLASRLNELVSLVNNTETKDNSSKLKVFLVSDEDKNEDDYADTYSFPLVLYFNEETNDNKSDIEIKIIAPSDEIKINNITLHKRDVIKTIEDDTDANSKLKSNNDNITEFNNVMNTTHNSRDTGNNNNSLNNITYVNNDSAVVNDTHKEISLSDFFMIMSDWFAALEGINLNSNKTELIKTNNESNTTDTMYPIYDSDMIENIGHRSRVLLSIDDPANITGKSETDDVIAAAGVKNADVGKSESNLLNTSIPTTLNMTQEGEANTVTDDKKKDGNQDNRTIVKRNADESNLIFWNDIYDDEYGIETERLDDALRDKNSVKANSLIKKSGIWMQEKIKKLAQNLKKSPQRTTGASPTRRVTKEADESEINTYPKYVYDKMYNKIRKRQADNEEDDYDSNQKSIFAAMTNNMREVCKKAARAVQKTRNIEVREDNKQETIATSLMQQLVQLMNDLVDYQVQQKTCAKLPPDLQKFLEWLTTPEGDRSESEPQLVTLRNSYQDDVIADLNLGTDDDKSINHQSLMFTNENTERDSKPECLGTLHDVQELMHQYEAMTDEDKSKMTGVKKYLEDQLDYLNKQISGYNDYNMYDTDIAPIRFRRDLAPHHKRRLKRKLHKFIKKFGKKHTRTTASYYDFVQVTDYKRKTDKISDNTIKHDGNENNNKETNDIDKSDDDINEFNDNKEFVKRNLKDVYYKAIADAKRYTTAESVQTNARKGRYDVNKGITQN